MTVLTKKVLPLSEYLSSSSGRVKVYTLMHVSLKGTMGIVSVLACFDLLRLIFTSRSAIPYPYVPPHC